MVYAKVVLDRQPLAIGQGFLPDWLRNKRDVIALDIFNDKLCLFRCIAVHRGAHVRHNIRKTNELTETFFAKRPGLRNRLTDKHIPLLEEHFKQGIEVYTVQPNGDFHLTHLPANYAQVGQPVLTMGLYDGHAFLIRDIKKVTRNFTCGDCQARFTKPCHLACHATNHCSRGQTKIICPNNRIQAPASAYELAFYPEDRCSFIGTKWLEWMFTFTMLVVAMGASDIFWAPGWMVITPRRKPSSSSTVASGMVVSSATPKSERGLYSRRPSRAM